MRSNIEGNQTRFLFRVSSIYFRYFYYQVFSSVSIARIIYEIKSTRTLTVQYLPSGAMFSK